MKKLNDYIRHHNEIVKTHSVQQVVANKFIVIRVDTTIITDKSKDILIVEIGKKLRKYYLLVNDLSLKHWSKTKIIQYVLTWDRQKALEISNESNHISNQRGSELILAENERNENLHTNFCLLNLYRKDDNTIVIKNKPYNYKNSIAYKAWGDKISDLKKKANLSHTLISLFDYKILNSVLFIHFSNFLCILLATFIRSKKLIYWTNIVNIFLNIIYYLIIIIVAYKTVNLKFVDKKIKKAVYIYTVDCLCIIFSILIIYLKLYNWHCAIIMPFIFISQINFVCNSILNLVLVESNGESTFELSFINMLVRTLLCNNSLFMFNNMQKVWPYNLELYDVDIELYDVGDSDDFF
ncbi:hypothetical protein NAPIS_ORF00299 [Vairimorpha apis BRL 01]|uniref:Uncharacterized protein n=1 Tax=Vairimorpha apis BRL 01 TaxID=1037528 RepID=T0L3Q0_9MICR|nr:hypothetical protein NAPIS_ORF00299 [Vairimorpha apis BRL 01]